MNSYPVKKVYNVIYKINSITEETVVVSFKTRGDANKFYTACKRKLIDEQGKDGLCEEGKYHVGNRLIYSDYCPYLYIQLEETELCPVKDAIEHYLK